MEEREERMLNICSHGLYKIFRVDEISLFKENSQKRSHRCPSHYFLHKIYTGENVYMRGPRQSRDGSTFAISNLKSLSYLLLSFIRSLHYINKYITASVLQVKYIISSATLSWDYSS